MVSSGLKPTILIIENDPHLCEALKAEIEDDAITVCFSTVANLKDAIQQGEFESPINAAIIQMVQNTKDELSDLSGIFDEMEEVPVYLTVNYDGNFQLEQNYIRSWTNNIFFRPFDVSKLVYAIKSEINKA